MQVKSNAIIIVHLDTEKYSIFLMINVEFYIVVLIDASAESDFAVEVPNCFRQVRCPKVGMHVRHPDTPHPMHVDILLHACHPS